MANEKFKINGVVSEVVPTIGATGDVLKKTGSGVEWGQLPVPNYPVTSVNDKTGAVTISKSDVGLGSVNNVAISQAQVTKLNELSYTKALTQAQYDALSQSEKDRVDVWYGIYK